MRGPDSEGPPETSRLLSLLVRLTLGDGAVTDSILTDLADELRERAHRGEENAALWYRRQALGVALRGGWDRLRGLSWRRIAHERESLTGGAGRMRWKESLVQDAREAARALVRSPGYGFAVIATFALAVGANVAVFSTVNGVLLTPLDYPDPHELVSVNRVFEGSGSVAGSVSYPDFQDWQARSPGLSVAAAYTYGQTTFTGGEFPEMLLGALTTPDLFRVLGVEAAVGRTFAPGEAEPGDDHIILSHSLWRDHFASDPAVVGTQVRVGSKISTVLGVMPPDFVFPVREVQFWSPLSEWEFLTSRGTGFLNVVARLPHGTTASDLDTTLREVAAAIDVAEGKDDGRTVDVVPLLESVVGGRASILLILLGAVSLVLLIACANIAGLTLSRSVTRSRELAIRAALGAGRGRIAQLLLWESAILAVAGACVGVALAHGFLGLLVRMAPDGIPRMQDVTIDGPTLLFAVGATLISAVLFGALPAMKSAGATLRGLRHASRGATASMARHRTQGTLVVSQVAVAMVLLSGAGLLANSFARLTSVDPGFDADQTLSMVVLLPGSRYESNESMEQFHADLNARLARVPGLEAIGTSQQLPFSPSNIRLTYEWAGQPLLDENRPEADVDVVGEEYFRAMGVPILQGRGFTAQDAPDGPRVAVVNETLAAREWPGESPLGKRLTFDGVDTAPVEGAWFTVVGVVPALVRRSLDRGPQEEIYLNRGQASDQFSFMSARSPYLVVRVADDPMAQVESVRHAIRELDAEVPVIDIASGIGRIESTLAEPRFRLLVISAFALLAGAVAVVGIYSLMAFVVSGRTKEIGVRMALGASPTVVGRSVVGRTIRLGITGVVAGLVLSLVGTRVLEGLLYGVTPHDPSTLVLVSLVLVAACALAGLRPAARAGRVDPLRALHQD